jgi:hypothetical protein
MSYEASIICDRCSRIICASSSARKARAENKEMGGRNRGSRDVCAWCIDYCRPEVIAAALNQPRASEPDDRKGPT